MSGRLYSWLIIANILILIGAGAYLYRQNSAPARGFPEAPVAATPTPLVTTGKQQGELVTQSPSQLLDRAAEFVEEDDFGAARSLINKAEPVIRRDRDLVRARLLQGRILAAGNQHVKAVARFIEAIGIDEDATEAYLLCSDSLRQLGLHKPAIGFLEEAGKGASASPLVELKILLARIQNGERREVAEELREAVKNNKLPSHLAYAHAVTLHLDGQADQARRVRESLELKLPEEAIETMLADPATPGNWRSPF